MKYDITKDWTCGLYIVWAWNDEEDDWNIIKRFKTEEQAKNFISENLT